MKARLLSIALAAVLLTACAEVPESVKTSSAELPDSRQELSNEIEFIPTDQLRADAKQALSLALPNFVLAEGLTVSLPEEYCQLDFTQTEGFEQRFDELAEKILGKDILSEATVDSSDYIENAGYEPLYKNPSRLIRDDEKQIHFNVHGNGFFCFILGSAFLNPDGGETQAVFFPQQGDDLSQSFELDGESVTLAEAAEFAQKWTDENYAFLEPDCAFRVGSVVVRKNEMDEYCYEVMMEKLCRGVELNNAVHKLSEDHDSLTYSTSELMLQMRRRGEISFFTNGTGIVLPRERSKPEKLASLSSILGYCANYFTDLHTPLEITEISLAYTLSPEYDYKNFQSSDHPGISYKSRLVWQLLMDVPIEQWGENGPGSSSRIARYIQIDAETGELEFEFETNVLG